MVQSVRYFEGTKKFTIDFLLTQNWELGNKLVARDVAKAPLGAMLRLRRSNEPGPPTAARFRVNVSHARFARAALCAVTNLTGPKLV